MSLGVELRDLIRDAIDQHSYRRAAALLAQLLREEPTASTASYVVSRFTEMRSHLDLTPCRIYVLRSFTWEPIVPLLQARCFAAGVDAAVRVGDFNAHAQEVLDAGSALYQFGPDIVILAVRTPDVAPALCDPFAGLTPAGAQEAVERTLADFKLWIDTFRRRSQAHLIVHTLEAPPYAARGVLDSQQGFGQHDAIRRINQGLQQFAQEFPGTYLLDYDALVARHGRLHWHDQRRWLAIRLPIVADGLIHLADEYMRFIHPLTGKVCKALVVDLDNTLWGGVVGEDGPQGIQVGVEYPGAAYQACQRVILDLYHRGVILAICSRNNPEDALEVLAGHPGMLLRPEHFAVMQINWNDKVENLRRIADGLDIGLDALAFLDDSPTEREAVRNQLPEVAVIDLPADPMMYAQTLRGCPLFERLALSEEDKARGRYYAEERRRSDFQRSARSVEEFYASLQMKAEIVEADPLAFPRIAQLTQKTNQFNLTTRRRTEQELIQLTADPAVRVVGMRAADRFGDSGLVGAAIWRRDGDCCEIDTFLVSCRVIGRTMETALLAYLADEARGNGATRLLGWYRPTKKNAVAKDFYPKHGFTLVKEEGDGFLWEFDLTSGTLAVPSWVKCTYAPRRERRENDSRRHMASGSAGRR